MGQWGCGRWGKVPTTRNPPMHGEIVQEMELNGFTTLLRVGLVFGLGYCFRIGSLINENGAVSGTEGNLVSKLD